MLDVRLFRRPEFVAVVCQPFTVTLGFVILLVYLPAYLQGVGTRSAADSGLLLLPMTAPVLLLPLIASYLAARSSARALLTGASALIVAGALLLVTLRSNGSAIGLALPPLPLGAGVGLAFGIMDNAAVSTVPVQNAGAAAGIFNTMRIITRPWPRASPAPSTPSVSSSRCYPPSARSSRTWPSAPGRPLDDLGAEFQYSALPS